MGLGTGALVAGLFGMNVGRVVTLFSTLGLMSMMSVNQPPGRTSTCILFDDMFIIGHCTDCNLGCVTQVYLFFLSKKLTLMP